MQIEAEISRGPIQFDSGSRLAADADEDHNRRRCFCFCCWRLIDTDGDGARDLLFA
jgi:hypothetical protein